MDHEPDVYRSSMADEDDRSRRPLDAATRGEPSDSDAVDPPPDDLFDVLADGTRRRILWYLLEDGRTTREELLDVLLGWRLPGHGIAGVDDRERLEVELRHVHLPKLVDCGFLSHDAAVEAGEIRLAALNDAARDLVRRGYRYDRGATGEGE
jgi:hypothetical protein